MRKLLIVSLVSWATAAGCGLLHHAVAHVGLQPPAVCSPIQCGSCGCPQVSQGVPAAYGSDGVGPVMAVPTVAPTLSPIQGPVPAPSISPPAAGADSEHAGRSEHLCAKHDSAGKHSASGTIEFVPRSGIRENPSCQPSEFSRIRLHRGREFGDVVCAATQKYATALAKIRRPSPGVLASPRVQRGCCVGST